MDHTSGNMTGLYAAEEVTLGQLPVTPIWEEREPNSYSDFGGQFAMTTRKPITHDRQHPKGEVSDNNPTGGFQEDLTPNNMLGFMQGFLFADAHEKPTTRPLNGAPIVVTAVDADSYNAAAGLAIFPVGAIILAENFGMPDNNGINIVTASVAGALTVASAPDVEVAPPADARLTMVGFSFGAGVASLVVSADSVFLDTGAINATTFGLIPGEFVFVGGDGAGLRFSDAGPNAPFYGRVSEVTVEGIRFDKTTGAQANNAGAGKTVQIFFGTAIRNEDDCTKIVSRSWTLERQYGCGAVAEAEYVHGWSPNQLTVNIPTPGADAKITVSLAGMATSSSERTVIDGGPLAGTRVVALNEPAFKPGLDVYQSRLAVIDETDLNPTALVAFSSEASLVVNNNIAGNKAIEVFGNSGMNVGEFSVTGSINAYFNGVEAVRRVRQGADLTWHLILTKKKSAIVFDLASLGLGNARASVEANAPIRLPLDTAAGKGKFGYTLMTTFFRYVPAIGMANQ